MSKVVNMLKDMIEKSKKDGEKDRDLYAKFKCYCDDNEADKKEEIAMAKDTIKMLENDVNKVRASSSELSTECQELKQGIAANEQARKDATSLREAAHDHFKSEEEDMKGALDSMESAIAALGAITDSKAALVTKETKGEQFMSKKLDLLKLTTDMKKAMSAVSVWLTQKQKRLLDSFIQAPFVGAQASQSSDIVEILKVMLDTFKDNLKNAQEAEKAAAEAHDKFLKLKEAEHETMTEAYEEKQTTLGENEDELASLSEQLATTQEELESAEEFLEKLLKMCAEKAKEFNERNILRANEEAAISKAISILNSDAAFEAFGKVSATKSGGTGPALLQISKHNHQVSVRAKVIELVRNAARSQNSLKMAKLAALLEAGNPFDSVLKEIDKMLELLDEEQKVDDEQKDWCKSEMDETKEMKETKEDKIKDLKKNIEELDNAINGPEDGLLVQIKNTEKDIKENHESQAKEVAEREEENKLFHITVNNCQTAEDLLKKAIKALKRYYDQFDGLLQKEDPAPPDTWEKGGADGYEGQKEKGGKVIEMLEFIAEETKKEEDEARKDEEEAVKEHEKRMEELEEELKKSEENLVELKETLAEKEKLLGEAKVNLERTEADLKAVKKYLKEITPGCEFIEEHYDTRKENRGKEKDALKEAIKLLKKTPAYKAAKAKEEEAEK